MEPSTHVIAVMLKYPEPGRVKTRLAAGLGAGRAAAIYRELVAGTLHHLPWGVPGVQVWICYDPPERLTDVAAWLAPHLRADVHWHAQAPGDLGQRLERVVASAFARPETATVTLVGTDCPEMRWPLFVITRRMESEGLDAVFGPAEDGGYYLLALRRPPGDSRARLHPLFHGIPWSMADTLAASEAAARAAGLTTYRLQRVLSDIDTLTEYESWTRMKETSVIAAGILKFQPLYMERVWGGRTLETRYHRDLPQADVPYGESWEVVDRPAEQSVVVGGPLAGLSLHDLWATRRAEVFGAAAPEAERFPLLVKILDARDTLSIQVHPPADVAPSLHGEPKTEMWFIAHAEPGAVLYAGLNPGVTRESFERALADGTCEDEVHRIPVKSGDFIFIPSGRLHAIGAGLLIFEIQQNSDTTYRVFDFNRTGLDGKPRALHIGESLQCIDFTDTAPAAGVAEGDQLVSCEYFTMSRRVFAPGESRTWGQAGEFSLMAAVHGILTYPDGSVTPGDFAAVSAVLPAASRAVTAGPDGAEVLEVTFGRAG